MLVNPDFPLIEQPENNSLAPNFTTSLPQRDFVHWVVMNIPENNVSAGYTVCPYAPACPLYSTRRQRYFFLLFRQERILNSSVLVHAENYFKKRAGLKACEWALSMNLELPIGFNGFQSEWTEFSDRVVESLNVPIPEHCISPSQRLKISLTTKQPEADVVSVISDGSEKHSKSREESTSTTPSCFCLTSGDNAACVLS
jgi:hypothetical protein